EFPGVEHRLEYAGSVRGVSFYNDSKATSVDAAAKAVSTFDRGVHLILGGKDKGAPYTPLKPLIEGRVKFVYLIGSAAEKIAAELDGANLIAAGDLETAVHLAFARAIAGDVVLLSPACSSYDQFEDFEARGRMFKDLVHGLDKSSAQRARPAAEAEPARYASPDTELQPLHPAPPPAPISELSRNAEQPFDNTPASESGPVGRAVIQSAASNEPAADPSYIYEVSGEDLDPAAADEFRPALPNEPAETAPLLEDVEPVSPYEVLAENETRAKRETSVIQAEAGSKSPDAQSAPLGPSTPMGSRSKPRDAGAGVQADLFSQAQSEKPFEKGK
ncbi:MAG: glutamate ligase domain-containing protein, partial [Terriglobia bacterium]